MVDGTERGRGSVEKAVRNGGAKGGEGGGIADVKESTDGVGSEKAKVKGRRGRRKRSPTRPPTNEFLVSIIVHSCVVHGVSINIYIYI